MIDEPNHFAMCSSDMQLKVIPAGGHVSAFRVGTVKSQKNQGFIHHFLGLEDDGKLVVFELYGFNVITAKGSIRR